MKISANLRGQKERRTAALMPWLCVCLIGIAFAANVHRATTLDMHSNMPMWVVMTIPSALSEIAFDNDKKYTVLKPVYQEYYGRLTTSLDADSINAAIAAVLRLDRSNIDRGYELLWDDDKGMVDLIALAFRLFGLKVNSIFFMYFVAMFASCAAYALAFFRRPACLLLLAGFQAMFFLVLPMIAFNPQLASVLTNRVLPLLSMVACLHLILFALRPKATIFQFALVIAQAALIIFTVHLRTTTMWQTTTIALISGWSAVVAWRVGVSHGLASRIWQLRALVAGVPLLLIVVGQLGLRTYQSRAFPEDYYRGDHMVTRVIWHSLFLGLAFNPQFAERYKIRLDDFSVVRALGEYLREQGRGDEYTALLAGPTPASGIYWGSYDPMVREMLVSRCTTHLTECLAAVGYYKPRSLAGNLAWVYGLRPEPPDLDIWVATESIDGGPITPESAEVVKAQFLATSRRLDETGLRAFLWTPAVLLLMLPFGIFLTRASRHDLAYVWVGAAALFAGSLIPTVIGFPGPHTVADAATASGMLIYLALCSGLAVGLRALSTRWRGVTVIGEEIADTPHAESPRPRSVY
jgi:hypothetical protein